MWEVPEGASSSRGELGWRHASAKACGRGNENLQRRGVVCPHTARRITQVRAQEGGLGHQLHYACGLCRIFTRMQPANAVHDMGPGEEQLCGKPANPTCRTRDAVQNWQNQCSEIATSMAEESESSASSMATTSSSPGRGSTSHERAVHGDQVQDQVCHGRAR